MVMPGRDIQVQTSGLQVVPVSIVLCIAKKILQPPVPVAEVGEWQPDVTLALVGSVVHCHQQPFSIEGLPDEGHEAIPRPVSFPAGYAFEKLPLTFANGRMAQHG